MSPPHKTKSKIEVVQSLPFWTSSLLLNSEDSLSSKSGSLEFWESKMLWHFWRRNLLRIGKTKGLRLWGWSTSENFKVVVLLRNVKLVLLRFWIWVLSFGLVRGTGVKLQEMRTVFADMLCWKDGIFCTCHGSYLATTPISSRELRGINPISLEIPDIYLKLLTSFNFIYIY